MATYTQVTGSNPASKLESSDDSIVRLVICNADGSPIAGGGTGGSAEQVQGTAAANAAAAGNPVQSGGVSVNPASPSSFTVGAAVPFQFDEGTGGLLTYVRTLTTGDSVTAYAKQYTTQSTFTPVTGAGTVFTLAAGQKGVIQNLAAAALYVKYGATASSTSFSFILPACTLASDGTSPPFVIEDFVGVVSIKAAASTESAIAYILS